MELHIQLHGKEYLEELDTLGLKYPGISERVIGDSLVCVMKLTLAYPLSVYLSEVTGTDFTNSLPVINPDYLRNKEAIMDIASTYIDKEDNQVAIEVLKNFSRRKGNITDLKSTTNGIELVIDIRK